MANTIKDQNRLRKVYSFYRAQPVPLNLNITNNLSGGGVNQNQLVGVWIDAWPAGSQMTTTGSIAIKAGAIQYASQAGSDVWFYVSGSGAQDRSVFATTALFSASVIASNLTGSLTTTAAGLSYLVGGTNITVTSQSNGQVVIAATTSTSGTANNNPWVDGNNKLKASSSVSIDRNNHFATDYGTDVFFYVSGSNTIQTPPSAADRKVVVLPDTVISGNLVAGYPGSSGGGLVRIGNWVASTVYGAAWFGTAAATPTGTNFALLSAGGDVILNAAAASYQAHVQAGNGDIALFGNSTSTNGGVGIGDGTYPVAIGQLTKLNNTDVAFYVSGSSGVDSGANRHVVVLPDTFISGASLSVGQGPVATSGSIRLPNKGTILIRNNANTGDLNLAQYDGANNLLIGDSAGASTSVYGPTQLILFSGAGIIAVEAATDIYMDGRDVIYRDAGHNQVAQMTVTNSAGVRWSATSQPAVGTDAFFYISGSIGLVSGADKHITVFGGDIVASGSISGSIQKTASGASYLVAGTNVSITSASNGQVTINAASGNGSSGWVDGVGKMKTTGSISIDASNRYADALGTDVFFFVSGSITASSTNANRKVALFNCDVVSSGGFFAGATSKDATVGKALTYMGSRFGVAPGGDAALYLLGPNNTGGATNYTLLGSDAGLEINTYGTTLYFEVSTTAYATVTANTQQWGTATRNFIANQAAGGVYATAPSGEFLSVGSTVQDLLRMKWINSGAGSIEFDAGKTSVTLMQNRNAAGNGSDFVIAAQQSFDGAFRGGNIILSGGVGGGTSGTSGSIIFKNGGIQAARFTSGSLHLDDATTGSYPAVGLIRTPAYAGTSVLWNGQNSFGTANIISQTAAAISFGDDNGSTGWTTILKGNPLTIQSPGGFTMYGAAGNGVVFKNYSTNTVSLTIPTGQDFSAANFVIGPQVTGSLVQTQSTSGKGADLTITAQQGRNIGQNSIQDGGNLVLQGGSPTNTSFMGSVKMQLLSGSTTYNMAECANVVSSSRVLALVTTSSLTNINMPSTTGDLVIFISNAATLPTTSSAGGGILYNDAGALKWYSPGGTQTTLAPNDPHCPRCGNDFVAEAKNTAKGWHRVHCFFCLEEQLSKIGIDPNTFAWTPKN